MTVGEGVKPAIEVDSSGQPHIAFMFESTPGFVKHAKLDGGAFVETLVGSAYYYGPLDIAINGDGVPAIAVHNHDYEDENVFTQGISGWNSYRVVHDGHDGWDNSIAFDSKGRIHTSSVDPSQFGSTSGVEYAWLDEENVWHVESIGSAPLPYKFSTSIRIDEKRQSTYSVLRRRCQCRKIRCQKQR